MESLMPWQQRIVDKVNENQESDVRTYLWRTIPSSIRLFWIEYFKLN